MGQTRLVSMLLALTASMMVVSCGGKVRSEFVAGCTSQGAPESGCECAYDKLEDHYGLDVMEEMQHAGVVPPGFGNAMVTAVVQCKTGGADSVSLTLPGSGGETERELAELFADILAEPVVRKEGVVQPASLMANDPGPEQTQLLPSETYKSEVGVDTRYGAVVENVILATATAEGGSEYKDVRRVETGDVNGDGLPDAAAMFTIEVAASNSYTQYLAVLIGQSGAASKLIDVVAVGGAGQQASDLEIEDGAIRMKVLTQGPNDPNCCPTLESEVEYLLHNGKLKRVG